jgi:hypothetical protein
MVREIRRISCGGGEFLRLGSHPYPDRWAFLVLALRLAFRAGRSGHPDDRRNNRRRVVRSRHLSNRAQRHRERQWLRHHVLSLDPRTHRFDFALLVVVDFRFAFCCELAVLCRLGRRLGFAPVFFAEILGAVGRTMIEKDVALAMGWVQHESIACKHRSRAAGSSLQQARIKSCKPPACLETHLLKRVVYRGQRLPRNKSLGSREPAADGRTVQAQGR